MALYFQDLVKWKTVLCKFHEDSAGANDNRLTTMLSIL